MGFCGIDGSRGEGGGQILRSAMTLSCITGTPVRVENIRHGRRVPGLRAQHLAAARILSRISGAEVTGMELGSTEMGFRPGGMREVEAVEDVGTAGSVPLVLYAAVCAASMAGCRTRITIRGGTDVPWSPTANYTKFVLADALGRFGIRYSTEVKRRGYFPRGGGEIEAVVEPCGDVAPVTLVQRTAREARLLCTFSKLDRGAVESECARIAGGLESEGWRVGTEVVREEARDGGASVLLYGRDDRSVAGADGLWDPKRGGFERDVAGDFLKSGLGADQNLADMLVVPASLAAGTSVFRVGRITRHLETNLYVASKITGCRYGVGRVAGGFEVRIRGSSQPRAQGGRKEEYGHRDDDGHLPQNDDLFA